MTRSALLLAAGLSSMSLARLSYAATSAALVSLGDPSPTPWNEMDPSARDAAARAASLYFDHSEVGATPEQLASMPERARMQGSIFLAIMAEAVAIAADESMNPPAGTCRILCTNLNLDASQPVNGVTFLPDRGQFISEPVSRAVAERFARIPGYSMLGAPVAPEADMSTFRDNVATLGQIADQADAAELGKAASADELQQDPAPALTATDTPPPPPPEEPPAPPPVAEVTEQAPPAEPATAKPTGKPGKAKPATATAA